MQAEQGFGLMDEKYEGDTVAAQFPAKTLL